MLPFIHVWNLYLMLETSVLVDHIVSYHRVVWYLEMEAYMMECGTRVKDVVLEHSTSRMETCSKAHGVKI